jgi:hypothetical protein
MAGIGASSLNKWFMRRWLHLIPIGGLILSSLIPFRAVSCPTDPLYADIAYPGDFINEQGDYLGNDGKDDGKLYVIKTSKMKFESFGDVKTAGISDSLARAMEKFIRRNSGDSTAFARVPVIYTYVQEIETSKDIRQKMLAIVSKDDGNGDTVACNNREYGGTVDNQSRVNESLPGSICDPSTGTGAGISIRTGMYTRYEFHSHPSGAKKIATDNHKELTWCYHQAASETDIERVGNLLGYVFGKRDNMVYIYNKQGILATLPIKYFIQPNTSGRAIARK